VPMPILGDSCDEEQDDVGEENARDAEEERTASPKAGIEATFMILCDRGSRGSLAKIVRRPPDAPARAVRNWRRHWREDARWSPYGTERALGSRVFTSHQEMELMEMLEGGLREKRLLLWSRTFPVLDGSL
jgi:hypothetical protein